MPIQIALGNPAPDAALELREVQPMRDGDFAAFLVVRSGAFAAAVPFFFTRRGLVEFTESLGELVAGGERVATLTSTGASFINFRRAGGSSLAVGGTLHDAERVQSLQFEFTAAREAAAPLLDGVRRLAETGASASSG